MSEVNGIYDIEIINKRATGSNLNEFEYYLNKKGKYYFRNAMYKIAIEIPYIPDNMKAMKYGEKITTNIAAITRSEKRVIDVLTKD